MWAESGVSGHYPGRKWAESGVNLGTILGECGLNLGYLGNILGGCGVNVGYLGTILGGCGVNPGWIRGESWLNLGSPDRTDVGWIRGESWLNLGSPDRTELGPTCKPRIGPRSAAQIGPLYLPGSDRDGSDMCVLAGLELSQDVTFWAE